MPNPEIVSYIKKCKEKNIAEEVIKKQLLASGWKESDITEALSSVKQPVPASLWDGADAAGKVAPRQSRGKLAVSVVAGLVLILAVGAWYYFLFKGKDSAVPVDQSAPSVVEKVVEPEGSTTIKAPVSLREDWEEYTNEAGAYSLRYPKESYHLTDGKKAADPVTANTRALVVKKNNSSAGLFISVNTVDVFADFAALRSSLEERAGKNPDVFKVGKNQTVGGAQGVSVEDCPAPTDCRPGYFVFSNNRGVRVMGNGEEKINDLSLPTREVFKTLSFKKETSPAAGE
jgi:hypothetical protein